MYGNLKVFRESLGLSQKAFADSLGLKLTTYNGYEKGVRDPDSEFWVAVAKTYHVSIDYLMGFEDSDNKKGPALSSEAMKLARDYDDLDEHGRKVIRTVADEELNRTAVEAPVVDLGTIRRYLGRPAAGPGGFIAGEDYEDIPRTPDMPKHADYCLTVSGDSMEPYIKDGELIFVDRDAPLHDFDVGIFVVNGTVYVKQFLPISPGMLMLLSANPKREDANITVLESSNDTVDYYGKVILPKRLPKPRYE